MSHLTACNPTRQVDRIQDAHAVSSSMGGDLGISTDDRNRFTERADVMRRHRSRID